jgi:cyclopropane-fatty-acyl-phospholipid synthase
VFSIEMFEHLRNWRAMLARIAGWLRPEGRMFLHVFTHRSTGYPFTIDGDGDWMARNFFTGGQMPADGQILYLQDDLQVERHWRVSGEHYRRTAAAWRQNFDRNLPALLPILQQTWNGSHRAMLHGWRTFFLSCEELFGYRGGEEWFVSHYRLRPRAGR